EIGLEFARFLEECPADAPDLEPARRFVERLRPGDPPDGQRYLAQAFTRYEEQRLSSDPTARTELAVLANLEIGLHEQTRLQPEIREALDAADTTREDLERRAVEALFPSARRWRRAAVPLAGFVASRVQRAASEVAREVITETLMVLALPERALALGVNLADPIPDGLRDPSDPELKELLARYEPVPPAADDCGATDWSVLEQ